jgi:hypothetical protein
MRAVFPALLAWMASPGNGGGSAITGASCALLESPADLRRPRKSATSFAGGLLLTRSGERPGSSANCGSPGIDVVKSTVEKYMVRSPKPSAPT